MLSVKNTGVEAVTLERGLPLAFSPGSIAEEELTEYVASLGETRDGTEPPRTSEEDSHAAGSAVRLDSEHEAEGTYLERDGRELVAHLIQDEGVVNQLLSEEVPPDQYYERLRGPLKQMFPEADPDLLEHVLPLVAAFDLATVFAMSFGAAKFQLAQLCVKLVGELVGRHGRSPNPEVVRAIKQWPPVRTLKDLQAFLGTANYVRPHMGPTYAKEAAPLRALLRPGATFPPNEEQLKAIERLKELIVEFHVLAVPDEAAAIAAANAWLAGEPATGHPYEIGADT